ncbi:hypothetical protein K0M31_018037 [Melipona bicolor]|uniref:Uncharacterized protein n=1 Tax=Melipona bicolor TaxID=60889 RepID=A0AA40KE93_9HYME|nr:hypothetical protein K0M31_018037 [Melipona bicolor]
MHEDARACIVGGRGCANARQTEAENPEKKRCLPRPGRKTLDREKNYPRYLYSLTCSRKRWLTLPVTTDYFVALVGQRATVVLKRLLQQLPLIDTVQRVRPKEEAEAEAEEETTSPDEREPVHEMNFWLTGPYRRGQSSLPRRRPSFASFLS